MCVTRSKAAASCDGAISAEISSAEQQLARRRYGIVGDPPPRRRPDPRQGTRSTFAPRTDRDLRSCSAWLASSNGYSCTSGRNPIAAAACRNSVTSRRVMLATLFSFFLHPEVRGVVELRERVAVGVLLADGVDHEAAAGRQVPQALHDRAPDGRRVDDRVERHRRRVDRVSGPHGAQFPGKRLLGLASGEDVDLGVRVAMPHEFQDEVGRGAEPRQTEPASIGEVRQAERAVADRAGAEQRRRLGVGHRAVRNRIRELLPDHHQLGVPAVGVPTRRPERRAEILVTRAGSTRSGRMPSGSRPHRRGRQA